MAGNAGENDDACGSDGKGGGAEDWMATPEMQQAAGVLSRFSDDDRLYHLYRSRLDYQRQQSAIYGEIEELRGKLAEERAAKEAALAEIQRLRALLADKGA